MKREFSCAVKAMIVSDGQILLLRRSASANGDHGYWEMPGGRLEFGESPAEALRREVTEETGLIVTVLGPVSVWTFRKTDAHQIIGITCLCAPASTDVRLSHEHADHAWVLAERLAEYNVVPGMLAEIKEWDIQAILAKAATFGGGDR